MLKSRSCDTIAGGIGIFAGWSDESRGGKGLGRLCTSRYSANDETIRNRAQLSGTMAKASWRFEDVGNNAGKVRIVYQSPSTYSEWMSTNEPR